jgi:hypothetical protein
LGAVPDAAAWPKGAWVAILLKKKFGNP